MGKLIAFDRVKHPDTEGHDHEKPLRPVFLGFHGSFPAAELRKSAFPEGQEETDPAAVGRQGGGHGFEQGGYPLAGFGTDTQSGTILPR